MEAAALMRYTAARSELPDTEWDAGEVVPGLWVGSLSAAEDAKHLTEHGVAHIVTVASRLHPEVPSGVVHTRAMLDDHPCANLLGVLPRALKAIDAGMSGSGYNSGSVLVHCASGVSRSVTACIAWLVTRRGQTLEEALHTVREARPQANPNFGFMQALQLLEACGGDLEAAGSRWQESSCTDVRDRTLALREAANAFHARADALEEALAQERSSGEAQSPSSQLRSQLEQLQQDIDSAVPQTEMDDRVARTIRRAAAQKVERLLG